MLESVEDEEDIIVVVGEMIPVFVAAVLYKAFFDVLVISESLFKFNAFINKRAVYLKVEEGLLRVFVRGELVAAEFISAAEQVLLGVVSPLGVD